jgi:tetratricopeptide (TPR) repeat protein
MSFRASWTLAPHRADALRLWEARSRSAASMVLAVAVCFTCLACQSWDRLEPSADDSESEAAAGELTNSVAMQRLGEIQGASTPEESLSLIAALIQEYPRAQLILQLQLAAAEAHSQLGDATSAASSYEKAIMLSGGDVLELPHESDLAYRLGWALYQAGQQELGAEWLVRSTFINDSQQLEQSLQFMHEEMVGDSGGFAEWLDSERASLAVTAPGFSLPGYQTDSVELSEVLDRATLVSFWSPT